jgi:hypothetical protein
MVKKIILITFLLKVGGYVISLKSSFHLFFTANEIVSGNFDSENVDQGDLFTIK